MYVTPQTNLKVYRNIPWNNDYKHVLWFVNASAQTTFFASKIAYTFTNFTYVRQTGVIRVPMLADNLYNCNYLSFQNESYGNKVFYAFITKVEYVNNETTHIYFEIDHIQTWLFNFNVEQCFVEREHVSDDTVGKHTVDEKIDCGEYMIEGASKLLSEYSAIMLVTGNDPNTADVEWCGGIPLTSKVYATASIGAFMADILSLYRTTPEAIGSLRMIVSDMCDSSAMTPQPFQETFSFSRNNDVVFHNACEGETYRPKNNKLKCYPYCLFTVDNFNGDVMQFRWEEFTNPFSANFKERGTPLPVPVMECFPINYKRNYSNPTDIDTKQFVVKYDNFPEIPFSSDTFKLWATSQFKKDIVSEGATVAQVGFAGAMALGSPIGSAMSIGAGTAMLGSIARGIEKGANMAIDYNYHRLHDSSLVGSTGNAGLNWNDNEVGFRFTEYRIKAEYAKIIDNFFTRFGYKVNVNKIPELTSRRYFNYIKTVDASIRGNVPNEAQDVICSMFDNGVTLWHTDDVGNYNVDNAIVG